MKPKKTTLRHAIFGAVKRIGKRLQVEGLAGELVNDVRHIQHVGFSSGLPKDTQVVMLPLSGHGRRFVVIGSTGAKTTIDVTEGETAIYDQFGHNVHLKKDGIHMKGDVFIDGDLEVNGDVADELGTMTEMRIVYNLHGGHSTSDGLPSTKME